MPYYLSHYIGAGTDKDPCKPFGSDQPGWRAIDLRADSGATPLGNGLNRCFLYLPVANPDARLFQLASSQGEAVPPLVRAGLAARLNATITYTRFDDLVADLLLRPPSKAWKPLAVTPTQPAEIWLGERLSPSPALRALMASFTETWTHADIAGSLTADLTWTLAIGTAWGITSNRARLTGNVGSQYARAESDTATSDQVVTATLSTFTTDPGFGSVFAIILCRWESAGTSNLYRLEASNDGFTGTWILNKVVAGVSTDLATVTTAPASGDAMELSAIGSTIQGKFNSTVVGPVTDTGITGNTRGGVGAYIDNLVSLVELDNWTVQDAAKIPYQPQYLRAPLMAQ